MGLHVVVGAGATGTSTALELASRGERVRLITRRGSRIAHPRVEAIAADATHVETLIAISRGADALYNCANPPYDRWLADWPPLHSALLETAKRTGAVLVAAATLYGYGNSGGVMTEHTPLVGADAHPKLQLRADMWREALAAHEAGDIRTAEVRSGDILQGTGIFSLAVAKPMLARRPVVVPVPVDQPHTFTSADDVARALITVAAEPTAWGHAWHVPSPEALPLREAAARFAAIADLPPARVAALPYPLVWAAGLMVPTMRELRATRYQWSSTFIMDSSRFTRAFGMVATPWDDALRDTARRLTSS